MHSPPLLTKSKSSISSSRRKRFQPPAITQISGSLHPCASSRSASLQHEEEVTSSTGVRWGEKDGGGDGNKRAT